MTTFHLAIDLDNASFEEEPEYELGRVLGKLGTRMRRDVYSPIAPGVSANVLDLNGNTVGRFEITGEQP